MNPNARAGFQLIWLLSIALCAILSLFVLFFASCKRSPIETADAPATVPPDTRAEDTVPDDSAAEVTPEPTATPAPPVELAPTEDQGEEYVAKIVFLGDSTTYGLGTYEILPFQQVWVPHNGTLTLSNQSFTDIDYYEDDGNVLSLSISDAAARKQPEYLIITLGLNGISFMDEDAFKSEYIDLIRSIQAASPDTKIICQSIYPVIDSLVTSDIGNDRIDRANGWIVDIAAETGTRYLNTHDAMTDDTGNLIADYNAGVGDGIHLNGSGYAAILNSVRTHGYR